MSDFIGLWLVAALMAACAAFCVSVGGWLGWSVAVFFAYYAVDMGQFALRLRRHHREFDADLSRW